MTINFLTKSSERIKKKDKSRPKDFDHYNHFTRDEIKINLWGLNLAVTRETNSPTPAELSVIMPRAEYRDGEIILSSITVVIAPRHAPEATSTSDHLPQRSPQRATTASFS
ncbi:MAG TPA: hypothetical protein PLJ33_01460 [Peptococcaceae bacterium]|jgi:hypothetical protein|nr:hypothetical protein [Peptococcaceae bacterium]HPZ72035.1 hypothetical protein [Peptococcaceae bacterium]HQD53506.1 hypothetical protein [Peptococcaceae bacterium]